MRMGKSIKSKTVYNMGKRKVVVKSLSIKRTKTNK